MQKKHIDYKYQLSQVITKYISKQFEYHYIMNDPKGLIPKSLQMSKTVWTQSCCYIWAN